MTATKRTEWTIRDAGPNSGNIIRFEIMCGDSVVCEIEDSTIDLQNDGATASEIRRAAKKDEAKARLIKAAPNLLAALQACEITLRRCGHPNVVAAHEARAAIREALGFA